MSCPVFGYCTLPSVTFYKVQNNTAMFIWSGCTPTPTTEQLTMKMVYFEFFFNQFLNGQPSLPHNPFGKIFSRNFHEIFLETFAQIRPFFVLWSITTWVREKNIRERIKWKSNQKNSNFFSKSRYNLDWSKGAVLKHFSVMFNWSPCII